MTDGSVSPGIKDIARRRQHWEQASVSKAVSKYPESERNLSTVSNIPVKRVYTPEDFSEQTYVDRLGFPGAFPFTRGIQPTMYRGRLWTRRQVVGLGTARETNTRHKFVFSKGQTGLSNDFDHPTLIGLDSDDPRSRREVGRIGVAIDTYHDMVDLFDGIPIDRVSTSFTINHPAPVILAMYVTAAETRGIPSRNLNGTTQNDPLKEFFAQKTFVFPPRPSVRLAVDLLLHCAHHMPHWNAMSVCGYQPRDAGCTADQEIAFAIADAKCYLEHAIGRGGDIDKLAPQITFLFHVHNDFLEEIAKFRAARRIWAYLIRDHFRARSEASCRLRMHVQTGGSTLTAQQPENNVVRGALQALAAVLGGTQSLAISCFDEALSIPSPRAQQISLRTQEIIAHESGVTNTVDPLGGSYFVESLTDQVEARAMKWMEEIDRRGGMLESVESGFIEQVITDESYRYHQQVQTRDRVIVGVNDYTSEAEDSAVVHTFRVDPATEATQIERLHAVRAGRDHLSVSRALDDLKSAASSDGYIMPAILVAARASASEGEIVGALKEVFGEYQPPAIF